eukprot:366229-Chlamydomonas_euryale.AAC.69
MQHTPEHARVNTSTCARTHEGTCTSIFMHAFVCARACMQGLCACVRIATAACPHRGCQHHLHRLLQAHEPRQSLRAAKPRDDTQLQLRQPQPRARRAHACVAAHGNLQATTECDAVDGSHCGLGSALQHSADGVVDRAVDAATAGALAELLDVEAGAEVVVGADDNDRLDAAVAVRLRQVAEKRAQQVGVQSIQRRVAQGDHRHAVRPDLHLGARHSVRRANASITWGAKGAAMVAATRGGAPVGDAGRSCRAAVVRIAAGRAGVDALRLSRSAASTLTLASELPTGAQQRRVLGTRAVRAGDRVEDVAVRTAASSQAHT